MDLAFGNAIDAGVVLSSSDIHLAQVPTHAPALTRINLAHLGYEDLTGHASKPASAATCLNQTNKGMSGQPPGMVAATDLACQQGGRKGTRRTLVVLLASLPRYKS